MVSGRKELLRVAQGSRAPSEKMKLGSGICGLNIIIALLDMYLTFKWSPER